MIALKSHNTEPVHMLGIPESISSMAYDAHFAGEEMESTEVGACDE